MIVPIFNSMMRIDRSPARGATTAARPPGNAHQRPKPLAKPGIVIGSIFVLNHRHGRLRHLSASWAGSDRLGRQDDQHADGEFAVPPAPRMLWSCSPPVWC